MTLILVVLIVILLLGGGLGYRQWGPRGGLGIVGTVLLIVLLLWVLGLLPLHGQVPETTPSPTQTFSLSPDPLLTLTPLPDSVNVDEPMVMENADGSSVAVAPAPPTVPTDLVADVAKQTAENFEAVENGEVEPEELTRDPSKTNDSGADMFFPVFLAFAAAASKYVLDEVVRRHPKLGNSTIGLISHGTTLILAALGFYAFHRISPALPQDLITWLAWSGFGQAGGGMVSSANAVRKFGVFTTRTKT